MDNATTCQFEEMDCSDVSIAGPTVHRDSPLQNLATELTLITIASLDRISGICLSYTCRRFRNLLDLSIDKILGNPRDKVCWNHRRCIPGEFEAVDRTMAIRKQHLKLLRRLDRDGKLLPTTAICNACATTHNRSWFSHDSLKRPNSRRECKGYTGKVWICPHQSLCHEYVNPDHYGPYVFNSDPRQRSLFFPPVPTDSCNTCRSVFRGSWSSVAKYAILNITAILIFLNRM